MGPQRTQAGRRPRLSQGLLLCGGPGSGVPPEYTTYFRSAIAFGTVRVVEDPEEKQNALLLLARRYAPEQSQTDHQREIDRFFSNLCIAELTIQHLTGKEAIELVRAKASAAP